MKGATDQSRRKLQGRNLWAGAAVLGAAALAFGLFSFHREKAMPAPARFTITPGDGSLSLFSRPNVSPDGQSVLVAVDERVKRGPVWYLYSLASRTGKPVPGTDQTTSIYWSFDSRSVLLSRSNAFWRMDLDSGAPERLPVVGAYSSWQREGILAGGRQGLRWFQPDGSGLRWIKRRDESSGHAYSYPSLLPGGRWFVYNATEGDGFSVHFASLDGKVDREILKAEHPAIYTMPGYLLFRRGDTLTAQAIDPESGKLRGNSSPIAGSIGVSTRSNDFLGSFSASDNGVLAFGNGANETPNSFTVIVNWPSLLKK